MVKYLSLRAGIQASVNPKAETVEELQGRRKHLHMGMLKLAREDLALLLQAGVDDFTVRATLAALAVSMPIPWKKSARQPPARLIRFPRRLGNGPQL